MAANAPAVSDRKRSGTAAMASTGSADSTITAHAEDDGRDRAATFDQAAGGAEEHGHERAHGEALAPSAAAAARR